MNLRQDRVKASTKLVQYFKFPFMKKMLVLGLVLMNQTQITSDDVVSTVLVIGSVAAASDIL